MHGTGTEQGGVATGDSETEFNVLRHFFGGNGADAVAGRDALKQRPVPVFQEGVVEFVLSDQKDVEQLGVLCFDIRQLPDFLQHFVVETLGFVDDDQHPFAGIVGFVQEMNEMNEKVTLAGKLFVDVESADQKIEKIDFFQSGVGNGGHERVIIEAAQLAVDEGRFAGADITHEEEKTAIVVNAELQPRQRLLVCFS